MPVGLTPSVIVATASMRLRSRSLNESRGIMGDHHPERSDEAVFIPDVTDEALERAGGPSDAVPTLVGTYCFTCPSEQEIATRSTLQD
jgi:hypothetical protein